MSTFFTNPEMIAAAAATLAVIAMLIELGLRLSKRESLAPTASVAHIPKGELLSKDQRGALLYLRRKIAAKGHVCPRVNVSDIFATAPAALANQQVDFAIIDAAGIIQFAVEIDDRKFNEAYDIDRANALRHAFKEAGIPLAFVLPNKLERSDELEFAISQLQVKRVAGPAELPPFQTPREQQVA